MLTTTHHGRLALFRTLGCAFALVLLVQTASEWCGIRLNTTASLPIGFYAVSPDLKAQLVEFCPPEPFGRFSSHRGYRGPGNCPDAAEPLMKPIVAIAGDTVELSPLGIAVNGRLLPNSAAQSLDSRHRPLLHWQFGKSRVAFGMVWVASSYSPRSFDSRYFGPISTSAIRDHLRPILTE